MSESMIDKVTHELNELKEEIARERDELKLQMHLFKADLKDEWHEAEEHFTHFFDKTKSMGEDFSAAGSEAKQAVETLGHNLKTTYNKLKDALKQKTS